MNRKRLLSIILAGTIIASSHLTGFAADNANEGLSIVEPSDDAPNTSSTEDPDPDDGSGGASSAASSSSSSGEDGGNPPSGGSEGSSGQDDDASDIPSDAASDASTEEEGAATEGSTEEEEVTEEEILEEESFEPYEVYGGYDIGADNFDIVENAPLRLFRIAGSSLPASYRTTTLPPLRKQSPYGTCWAFSTTALVEINLLKKGRVSSVDLSELHLAYFAYNMVVDPLGGTDGDYYITPTAGILNRGGTYGFALDTLSQWMGSADESVAMYGRDAYMAQTSGLQEAIAFDDFAHLEDFYIADVDMASFRRNRDLSMLDPIKKLVVEHGAVGLSFLANNGVLPTTGEKTYSKTNNCYYNPGDLGTGHGVAIIGWDDSFSKEKFTTTPPGDGAFLVRNSWMTEDEGNINDYSGYFWMSYYENTLQDMFYAVNAELADNYDNNYQYDGSSTPGYNISSAGANVFTAHAEGGENGEVLKAVSFYALATNVGYTVEIYKDVVDTPDSGVLVEEATTTGRFEVAGFHTVPLNSNVYVEAGSKFAVVVKLTSAGLAREISFAGNSYGMSSKPGESFSLSGNIWVDKGTSGNFKIKAYTDNADAPEYVAPTDISFENVENNELTLNVGAVYKVVAKVIPADASDRDVVWSSSDESVATVLNGQITPVAEGNAVITASLLDGQIVKQINVTVQQTLLGITLARYRVYTGTTEYTYYKVNCNPSSYVPSEKPVWTSSDEDVVTIDENGVITEKMMGRSVITASLEGKTVSTTHEVSPKGFIDYEVSEDNVITLEWSAAKNATGYIITRGAQVIATIADNGSNNYIYVDEYFKYKDIAETLTYSFYPIYSGADPNPYTITIKPTYNISYVLGIDTQNPDNPGQYHEGDSIAIKPPVSPRGYTFVDWYEDQKFTRVKNRIYSFDKGNITLYAKWIRTKVRVSFDANGGTVNQSFAELEYGSQFAKLPTPTRPGYWFGGWYTEREGGEQVTEETTVDRTEAYTVYAHWTSEYNITFD